jgi:glycosyltransferase involved in cell wall biosynthesis
MREIVSISGPDQCGFHINPNDPSDIAWGIVSAVTDPQKRVQFGRNGRKRVLELFSWDTAAKTTLDRYAELVQLKKSEESSTETA